MKKTTISLFLVLAMFLSFAGCTTASIDEETTVISTNTLTTLSSEDLMSANSVLNWIDSVFEQKRSDSYGGLRPSIAEQVTLHIQQKIAETPTEGPNYYSIEYLPHPESTEGFFQVSIRFDATNLNKEILNAIENGNPKSKLYISGYSKAQIEDILTPIIKDAKIKYEIFERDGYCCLVIN